MAVAEGLEGRHARLAPVEVTDAADIIAIRNQPGFDVGLPPIPDDVPRQRAWIDEQRGRPGDYYFGIRGTDDPTLLGTIGVTQEPTRPGPWADNAWEWGRWVCIATDPRVALESAALTLRFAIDQGAPGIWVRILPGNAHLAAFHRRLGYSSCWENDEGIFLAATPADVLVLIRRLCLL